MKLYRFVVAGFLATTFLTSCQQDAKPEEALTPVTFEKVTLADEFWLPRLELQKETLIPFSFGKMEPAVENIRRIGEYLKTGKRNGNDFLLLLDTFQKMQEAADILLANTENPALINEMRPWLIQHKLIGELGERVLWMIMMNEGNGNQENALRYYKHAKALQQQIYTVFTPGWYGFWL